MRPIEIFLKFSCQTPEELVYDLTLNCNDMVFHVGIARKDLLGEPVVGRRFKGQIWMQGVANFEECDD